MSRIGLAKEEGELIISYWKIGVSASVESVAACCRRLALTNLLDELRPSIFLSAARREISLPV